MIIHWGFSHFLFLLLWKCMFSVHCVRTHTRTHTGSSALLSITKLLSVASCSWLVFTYAAGIVLQRVLPSPFRAVPLGLMESITFWKLGPVWDFFFYEQRYREQLTIALSWGALSALCLITWKVSRGVWLGESNCCLIQYVRSAPGQDRSLLHVCDLGPVHFICFI